MNMAIWLGLGAVALVALWRLLAPGLQRDLDRALRSGELAPLLERLARLSGEAQSNAYNRAIRRFWDAYQRPLAVQLVRALAEQQPGARIAQYWLDQVRSVEPQLASESLGQAFYDEHFQPQVAATCGKAG